MLSTAGRIPWIPLGLVVLVLLAFGQVATHEFVEFDDGPYVDRNPWVTRGLSLEGLRWSLTTFHMGNWHPLTWLSHMLDVELFGRDAGMHHLVSALLHAASAVLLYLALLAMTGARWSAAWVAALFALHPTHVESVAWAAERKDVLAALFFMATLVAYARYAARPATGRYLLVVAAMALGLLAKPMLVTLPFVLLLLDIWPLRRLHFEPGGGAGESVSVSRLLLEKLPLFVLAAAGSWMAVVAQQSAGAVGSAAALPFGARLENAIVSYGVYLWQTLWPAGLSFYYPHPALTGDESVVGGAGAIGVGLLLAAVSVGAVTGLRRRPYLAVGWFWYLGMLVPVIGLLQVGMQARADRYTYLPAVGLYIAVAWAFEEWARRAPGVKHAVAAAGGLVVALCLVASWIQAGHWRDSRTLAEHALRVNERNFWAHNMLGVWRHREGDVPGADRAYRRALEVKPDFTEAQLNLATLVGDAGRLDEARELFELVLRLSPEQAGPRAHNGLGAILLRQGDAEGALVRLRRAVELEPDFPEAYNNLGAVYEGLGRFDEARASFERALSVYPGYATAHLNLGGVLIRQGDLEDGVRHLERALALDPEMIEARRYLERARALERSK